MKTKRLRQGNTAAIAILLIIAVLNSGVFIYAAVFRNEVSVKNLLKTGSVDIELTTWEVTGDGFVTKGDANNSHDLGVVTPDDYIGKNVCTIPYLGYVLRYICITSGKIMAITILICIALLLCILPPNKYRCRH